MSKALKGHTIGFRLVSPRPIGLVWDLSPSCLHSFLPDFLLLSHYSCLFLSFCFITLAVDK